MSDLCSEKKTHKGWEDRRMGKQKDGKKRKEPCYYSAVMSKQMGMAAGGVNFCQDCCITLENLWCHGQLRPLAGVLQNS